MILHIFLSITLNWDTLFKLVKEIYVLVLECFDEGSLDGFYWSVSESTGDFDTSIQFKYHHRPNIEV